jgi:WD40 repeat protein
MLVSGENAGEVRPHEGAILASAAFGAGIVTGGDDGRVVVTNAAGQCQELARDPKARWIDQVAAAANGAVAWSAGREAFTKSSAGEVRSAQLPSAAGGIAFAPKGFRAAISHYNGATLWFPNASAKPEFLEWKGSHLGVTFSPDGKFVITSMQEPMLHGWRLADGKHMRMSGYSAKVRSLSWTQDGRSLATSGSEQVILWPFHSKDGPMGKAPRMLAPHSARVTAVACHPREDVIAAGYADGTVLLVRIDDAAEVLARRPAGSPITALAWSARGEQLAFGAEAGDAGVLTL